MCCKPLLAEDLVTFCPDCRPTKSQSPPPIPTGATLGLRIPLFRRTDRPYVSPVMSKEEFKNTTVLAATSPYLAPSASLPGITLEQESPFANFANNLSPINATKATHISQTFNSLSFTSPPSVFTSPHVSLQKESRFLRRHQVSDLAKPQLSSNEGNKDFKAEQILSADQRPQCSRNEQVRDEGASSSGEASIELPRMLKYDSGSPDCKKATTSAVEEKCEPNMSEALVPYVEEPSVASFGAELNAQEMDHDNDESCDWQSLISGSIELFVSNSPNEAATLKGSFQKSLQEETNVLTSLLSRFPPDHADDPPKSHYAGPLIYNEAHENIDQSTQPADTNELEQMDPPESLAISSMNDYISGDSVEKSGNESFYSLHRGLRRRCLDFEMPRAKKSIHGVLFSSSSSALNEEMALSEQSITPVRDSSSCILPGIGLHLNTVAATSKDCKVLNQETPSPSSQLQVIENSSQAFMYAATEELNSISPKKKRRKLDNIEEDESCKRCNCKKSKCLKLYCECFAAGVYCVEPCSCQDCFNKPIHEETVLATRKKIESRNPLAFAPKVIRTLDSAQEVGEDSTRTPASARHKRGCNCKKSNCLKKYCECYQGGVGCSINCRCEGCKNAFGRKDDHISNFKSRPTLLRAEAEKVEARASERHIMDMSLEFPALCDNDEDQNSELTFPKTPLRPSIPLPTSSKGKLPISSIATMGSSSFLNPTNGPGRSTFLRSQSKIEKFQGGSREEIPSVVDNSSPPSNVKTLSPNSKRISLPHDENGPSPALSSSHKLILQSIPSFPSLTPRR